MCTHRLRCRRGPWQRFGGLPATPLAKPGPRGVAHVLLHRLKPPALLSVLDLQRLGAHLQEAARVGGGRGLVMNTYRVDRAFWLSVRILYHLIRLTLIGHVHL
jgi:hypothetical protein